MGIAGTVVENSYTGENAWNSLCPVEGSVRCMLISNVAICTGSETLDASMQSIFDELTGCSSTWEPVPMSVVVTMSMAVADPEAFVADSNSKATVEAGIAAAANVAPHKVSATLTVGSRRLQGSGRRLQGTVAVSAEILADTAAAVAGLAATVNAISSADMTTNINSALVTAGLPTVTVSSLVAETAPAPERYVAPTVAPTDLNENTAHQMTFWGGMAVLALAMQF